MKKDGGSWDQKALRMRKIRVIFVKENFKNSYLLVFHPKCYDYFFYFIDLEQESKLKI